QKFTAEDPTRHPLRPSRDRGHRFAPGWSATDVRRVRDSARSQTYRPTVRTDQTRTRPRCYRPWPSGTARRSRVADAPQYDVPALHHPLGRTANGESRLERLPAAVSLKLSCGYSPEQ